MATVATAPENRTANHCHCAARSHNKTGCFHNSPISWIRQRHLIFHRKNMRRRRSTAHALYTAPCVSFLITYISHLYLIPSELIAFRGGGAGGTAFEQVLTFRVAEPSWGFQGVGVLISLCNCNLVDGVNPDQSVFVIRVEGKTAPRPVLGMIDQFSLQWVHVHVVKFFHPLLQAPHVILAGSPSKSQGKRVEPAPVKS
jgi:hypothetical protein